MKNILMMTLFICVATQIAPAQNRQDAKMERDAILKEMAAARAEAQKPVNALLAASDLGEPDSFGKNVLGGK